MTAKRDKVTENEALFFKGMRRQYGNNVMQKIGFGIRISHTEDVKILAKLGKVTLGQHLGLL